MLVCSLFICITLSISFVSFKFLQRIVSCGDLFTIISNTTLLESELTNFFSIALLVAIATSVAVWLSFERSRSLSLFVLFSSVSFLIFSIHNLISENFLFLLLLVIVIVFAKSIFLSHVVTLLLSLLKRINLFFFNELHNLKKKLKKTFLIEFIIRFRKNSLNLKQIFNYTYFQFFSSFVSQMTSYMMDV